MAQIILENLKQRSSTLRNLPRHDVLDTSTDPHAPESLHMTLDVVVKHAGKKYDLQLDETANGREFKAQLEELTGVPIDRQKILVKGGQVKDDAPISELKLVAGQTLMMLGTAGQLPVNVPKVDPTPVVAAVDEPVEPKGLVNIGNTCYANSTVQALRALPEVKEALAKFQGNSQLVRSLGTVLKDLDATKVTPVMFMLTLRSAFPQFDERDPQSGMHKQQDAEELWTQLHQQFSEASVATGSKIPLDRYFEGMFETKMVNSESAEEPAVEKAESFNKLSCHISINTNFMRSGLLDGLTEEIEKHSELLGRDAKYTLEKKISRLPKYLTVQMVRFYWRRDTRQKSKILRKVAFPQTLDIGDMCTEGLRKQLIPARDALREMESEFEDARRLARRQKFSSLSEKKDKLEDQLPVERQKELVEAVKAKIDPAFASDPSANPYGIYELQAVITHRGQSADSGHYMCFVKNEQGDGWWCFNDDKVYAVDEAKIESLAGGGESDSGLILLYKTPELKVSGPKSGPEAK